MRRRVGTLLVCSFLLPLAACGGDGDGDADGDTASPSVTATTATSATSATTVGTAGDSPSTNGDPAEAPDGAVDDDFCGVLIEEAAKLADFRGKIGTPEEVAALEEAATASSQRVLAAAPDELSDAIATINSAESPEAASSPEAMAAFDNYRTWVMDHCGADAATILATGG